MKIGFSLTPKFIEGIPTCTAEGKILKRFTSVDCFLGELKDSGVYSIELRDIKPSDEKERVKRLLDMVYSSDLEISVHGLITDNEDDNFDNIYPSLSGFIKELEVAGKKSVFVVHSFGGMDGDLDFYTQKTGRIIEKWSQMELPLIFALEINRYKEDKIDPSASMESMMNIIEPVPEERAGFCFDFGHYIYNRIIKPEHFSNIPPAGFLKRSVHTHIHGLRNLQTHHLFEYERDLPLKMYVEALRNNGYEGIYNIEFSLERFPEDTDAENAVFRCIERLQNI